MLIALSRTSLQEIRWPALTPSKEAVNTETDMIDTPAQPGIGRRTVIKGVAWSVPAVTVVGATPAFAKTGDTVTFASVAVNTPPTGAPNHYINISNQNSSVTVGGSVTSGATVTVTVTGGDSATATTTGTTWTHTFPAASLPQGTLAFTASVAGPPVVSVPGPRTVVKDTSAPAPTIPTFTYVGRSTKTLTVGGAAGNATTPTADSSTMTLTGGPVTPVTVTRTGATWTHTYNNVTNNVTYTIVITQTDGAGNSGSASRTSTT